MGFAIFALGWITLGWLSVLFFAKDFNKTIIYKKIDNEKGMSTFMVCVNVCLLGPIVFGLIAGVIVGVEGAAQGKYKSTKYP